MVTHKTASTRRRVLKVGAGGFAFALMPGGLGLAVEPRSDHEHIWRGKALGREVSARFYGPTLQNVENVMVACAREVARLDSLFSLQDRTSALSRLNREGYVANPDLDFVRLLRLAANVSRQTAGAFDITVKPLCDLYNQRGNGRVAHHELARVQAQTGHHHLRITHNSIRLTEGEITLDGIAPGYIADRLTDLLRQMGGVGALVSAGEYAALGRQTNGDDWRVHIPHPQHTGAVLDEVGIANRAIATSSSQRRRVIDPRTAGPANRYLSVSVNHIRAAMADALATAFHAMTISDIRALHGETCSFSALILDKYGVFEKI